MDSEPRIGAPPEPEYQPPDAGLPSTWTYRGALLALAVGSLVAVYLFISPPESKGKQDQPRPVSTPTPATGATATPTQPGSGTTRTPTPTLAITATPTGTLAPSVGAVRTYTVRAGDTLSSIAVQFDTTVDAIVAANPGLDPETINIGEQLRIPGR